MRLAILMSVALLAVLALLAFPQARADDAAESPPAKPALAAGLWESHVKTYDLDGDGRITWEEYQKVMSGFTFFDADKDGVITKSDVEALGEKLAKGIHEGFFFGSHGMPGGGLGQFFGNSGGNGAGWMQFLPLLLGGQGGPGMHGTPGMQGMPGMHGMHGMRGGYGMQAAPWMMGMGPFHPMQMHGFHPGMGGGCGANPWMGGMRGYPGMRGFPGWQGYPGTQGFHGMQGATPPVPPPAPHAKPKDHEVPDMSGFAAMLPDSMKHLVAFGMVAQQADTDGDHAITKDEWTKAVKALTKDDGTLDLEKVGQSAGMHGLPIPGGGAAIFQKLLDADGNGKVEPADLDGVFEKADKNSDGKVDHSELIPAGMGMGGFEFPGAR